ncbi:hypothetical protein P3T36_007815 [Kitasatospora sp. MAP12-15]|nr:hypothetical protein [Kitasatospora sp. MAP12-44]
MKANQFTHSAGSKDDSPGLRRGVIPRAGGTEERTYGSSSTGGSMPLSGPSASRTSTATSPR